MKKHGIKGIVGAERAKTYNPSSFQNGDQGGAAGGYGVGHGMMNAESGAMPIPGVTHGYVGTPVVFEGGFRGGGVSELETLPAQYPYPKKIGYDEHTKRMSPGAEESVHGMAGVEGIPQMPTSGHACGQDGCGFTARSSHGLARHTHSMHGGFGGLGHALRGSSLFGKGKKEGKDENHDRTSIAAPMPGQAKKYESLYDEEREKEKHGSSYGPAEFRGETEGPKEWAANKHEWSAAKSLISPDGVASSYDRGDQDGSYGRMRKIVGK